MYHSPVEDCYCKEAVILPLIYLIVLIYRNEFFVCQPKRCKAPLRSAVRGKSPKYSSCQKMSKSLQMIQSKIYFNGKRNKTEGKQLDTKNDLAVDVRVGHTIWNSKGSWWKWHIFGKIFMTNILIFHLVFLIFFTKAGTVISLNNSNCKWARGTEIAFRSGHYQIHKFEDIPVSLPSLETYTFFPRFLFFSSQTLIFSPWIPRITIQCHTLSGCSVFFFFFLVAIS